MRIILIITYYRYVVTLYITIPNCYRLNQDVLLEAKRFGYKLNEIEITQAMVGKSLEESGKFCKNIRDTQLSDYLDAHLKNFNRQKRSSYDVEKLKPVIIAEQQFLKETYTLLKFALNEYNNANCDLFMNLQASAIASEKPELINKIFDLAGKLIREHGASEMSVYRDLSFSINAATVY